jgi:hypothetical protein
MYLSEAIVIFIMMPLIYGLFLPYLETSGRTFSVRARMTIGIVFAILSIVAAGVLEYFRRRSYWEGQGPPVIIRKYNC